MAPGRSCVWSRSRRRPWTSMMALPGLLLLAACQLVSVAEPPAPPPESEPGIEEGFTTPEERGAGTGLLARMDSVWAGGDVEEAVSLARTVVGEYPRVARSSRALRVLAEGSLQLGAFEEAAAAADRYAALFPPGSASRAEGLLLQGEALEEGGDPEAALMALLYMAPEAPPALQEEARERVGSLSRVLGLAALERLVDSPGVEGSPVGAPLLAEWATVLHFQGEEGEAEEIARVALARGGVDASADSVFRAIVEGRADEVLGVAPLVGAILPMESGPSIRPFADAVEEGIRLAIEVQGDERRPVQLRALDDGAVASRASSALATLEEDRVLAVLGPLLDDALAAGVASRTGLTPMISPTARSIPEGAENVYSLAAADPTGGHTLARWALDNGIRSAAMLYPRDPAAVVEARAFAETFRAGGGSIVLDRPFERGTSFFREQMQAVAAAAPDVLVLPLAPEEVEIVAPQVTFYGLDSLGIRVLGTGGWTAEETLRDVDVRHTEGVVAVTSRPPGVVQERYREFVRAYEAHYQKTLRTPVAALGYDAARLLMRALESGARTPAEVARALEGIRDFPGATGDISVVDGRIVRRSVPVRLENRALVLLGPDG